MSRVRRFLIAPSLVRIIRRERPGRLIVEGHFAPQGDRQSLVQIENDECWLVLAFDSVSGRSQTRTPLPTEHAQALLDVCQGVLRFERSTIGLDDRIAFVERLVAPAELDVVTVPFDTPDESAAFAPPAWLGPEVTEDPSYTNAQLALSGLPQADVVEPSNTAVDALLNLLDGALEAAAAAETNVSEDRAAEPLLEIKRRPSLPRALPAAPDVRADDWPTPALEVADPARRRPTLPRAVHANEDDRRLASVVEGLTAALAEATPLEHAVDGGGTTERGWRWSRH